MVLTISIIVLLGLIYTLLNLGAWSSRCPSTTHTNKWTAFFGKDVQHKWRNICVGDWGFNKYEYDDKCDQCNERRHHFAFTRSELIKYRGFTAEQIDKIEYNLTHYLRDD